MRSAVLIGLLLLAPLASPVVAAAEESDVTLTRRSISLYVPAVGQLADGTLVGVLSVLTLAAQSPGRGDIFVRVEPLAELDMQGSARLAVEAAGEVTGRPVDEWDFFFTITTGSPIIGGPSAGAAMTTAAAVVLMNWTLDPDVAMTGMINPDLSIGLVGGILQKAEAVAEVGVHTFLIPAGERFQYVENETGAQEAVDIVTRARNDWGLTVHEVEDMYDVLPHFTGLAAQRPATNVDPTRQEFYLRLMATASGTQLADATDQHGRAVRDFVELESAMSVPARNAAESANAASQERLAQAQNASAAERHYQAASYGFQSLVQSRYALALLDFYRDPAGTRSAIEYTDSYIEQVSAEQDAAKQRQQNAFPWTANELGAQAALELRLREADDLLDDARVQMAAQNFLSALEMASFARERLRSVAWWADVRAEVTEAGPAANVTEEGLLALADEYASSAKLMIGYAEVVFGEAAIGEPRLARSVEEFQKAEDALDDDHFAAGLFGILESMSLVNAAMANLNPPDALTQRLETLRQRTAYEIELLRTQGIEPVYAASLFEFSVVQEAVDPVNAYETLTYARMAARATLVAGGFEPPPTKWITLVLTNPFTPDERVLQGAAWAWMALLGVPFVVAAAVAVVLAASPLGRAKDS